VYAAVQVAGAPVRRSEPKAFGRHTGDLVTMRSTVQDLAKARPGLRVSELAELLSLDVETASAVARAAVEAGRVAIAARGRSPRKEPSALRQIAVAGRSALLPRLVERAVPRSPER